MKNFTFCLSMFFLMILQGHAQVSIGNGTAINKHVPFEANFSYSYAQSIYLASEIATSGNITAVRWYFSGATSDDWNMQGLDYSQDIQIYIGHTSKTEFDSNEDWIAAANLELAYSGGIPVEETGWVTVDLDVPFSYNGTDNLVIAVKESMEGSDPPDADFWAFQVVGNRSISSYGFDPYDINEPPFADYLGNYVPNIVFEGIIQPCPPPVNIEVTEIGTGNFTMTWDPFELFSSGGPQYYISESDENPTAETNPSGSVESGVSTLTVNSGLNPGTQYYIWLRDVCEDGPGNWSYAKGFITGCLPVATLSENFDNLDSLPICWSTLLRGEVSEDAFVTVVDWDAHSAMNSVLFNNDSSSPTADIFLISPALDNVGAGTHRLKFFASSYSGAELWIGSLDSNLPDAVFSDIEIVTITSGFNEYTVDFTGFTVPGSYLAIRMTSNNPYSEVYVDDIRWELAPDCSDVTEINVPLTTTSTATIAWTPTGGETAWEMVVALSDVTSPEGLTTVPATITPTGVLEDLAENTSYKVWVRSICEAGVGAWIGPVAFTTACSPVINFSETFEASFDMPFCWTSIIRGTTLNGDEGVNVIGYNANGGNQAVEIRKGFSESDTDDVMLVSPNLANLTAGTHRLKFFAKNEGAAGLQIGTLTSNTNAAVFTPFEEVTVTGTYAEYKIDFSTFEDNDAPVDSYIGIRLAPAGNESCAVFIDDVKWEVLPLCPDPSDLSASVIGTDSATIEWVAGGSEMQWQIVFGESTVEDPSELTPSSILTTTTLNLTELVDNTAYKVWVRSVCTTPEANGDWNGPFEFRTKCIPVTYIYENFDSVALPDLPGCWSSILRGETLSDWASIGTDNISNSEPYAVRLSNSGSAANSDIILVSPALGNLSGLHQLKFTARKLGFTDIQIGTLDNNSNTAIFTSIQTVTLNSAYTQHTIVVDYDGDDTYLGFRIVSDGSYGSILIDDVIWEEVSACTDAASLTVSEITTNSAQIEWENFTGDVQVAYGLAAVTNPNTLPIIPSDGSLLELTGLQSNTAYKFWVRSVCAEGFGSWIGPIEFYTKCSSTAVPYTEDFEGLLVPAMPNCSTVVNAGVASSWLSNYPVDYESVALTYFGGDLAANAWFFTQGINLNEGQNYTISYDFGNRGFDATESFKVMYGTGDNVAAMTFPLANHPEVTEIFLENNEVSFTAPTTGVYYFGFNVYSSAGQGVLFVDNIQIDADLSNGDFNQNTFSSYPNPVNDYLNLRYNQDIFTVEVYTILGQLVSTHAVNSNSARINMTDLPHGTYIVKVKADNYTKSIKVLKR